MHVGAAVRRLAVLLLLGLAACEAPLDPIAESDLAYSFSGYLDASADTQWVRVEPFGRVNAPTPGPLDAVVSLVKPDGTVRPMTQEVRTFETGPAHLFWSTEDVVPAASYRIEVRGADGTMAVAPVDVPDDSALEIDLVDGLIHCPTVVRVSGAEFLVDVQARYVTPDGRPFRFSKVASFAVLYDSMWPLACNVVLFFYLQDIVVPAEEKLLGESFGAEFEAYKAAVNRWWLF